jgi:hypothetical protein
MTASTALLGSVRAAFGALIDYAGLFPPAQLPLEQAQSQYQAACLGPYSWMLGRFIIPASLLIASPDDFAGPFSVIAEGEVETLNRLGILRQEGSQIEAVEIPLNKVVPPFRKSISRDEILNVAGELEADIVVAGLRDLPTFVEIPRTEPWCGVLPDTMGALARMRLGAKLRCGGITAEAFPTVVEIAEFIAAAQQAQVSFKATAGLHHPVRHRDKNTGFTMHGFLNILAAAALAPRASQEMLRRVLAEEEASAFVFDDESLSWRNERIDLAELTGMRREAFVAYGSCSFAEPVEDLTALGLLTPQ